MSYKGDIIEESLADKAILEEVNIISTRVEQLDFSPEITYRERQ